MKKFFKRLSKTQFLILFFIPFGVYGFCHNGWLGLAASVFGYGLGYLLCENWNRIRNFPYKKFFRRHVKAIVQLVIFIPIATVGFYYYGWKGLLVAILGWCVGEIISRRILK